MPQKEIHCSAFGGTNCIASGTIFDVAEKAKKIMDKGHPSSVIIFDDVTSEIVEIDFRGTLDEVMDRLKQTFHKDPAENEPEKDRKSRGPGRPKLGVVSREVTLLPRHWEWLSSQPGGASVALRKLVEEARHANRDKDRIRNAKESVYRFMSSMAGNLPGYEEALRALYKDNPERLKELIANWPEDIRNHTAKIAKAAF